jgi:hypothetical protein
VCDVSASATAADETVSGSTTSGGPRRKQTGTCPWGIIQRDAIGREQDPHPIAPSRASDTMNETSATAMAVCPRAAVAAARARLESTLPLTARQARPTECYHRTRPQPAAAIAVAPAEQQRAGILAPLNFKHGARQPLGATVAICPKVCRPARKSWRSKATSAFLFEDGEAGQANRPLA